MIRQTIWGPLLHEAFLAAPLLSSLVLPGCARLPSVAEVVHDDPQMTVTLQNLVHVEPYTHPVQITEDQFTAILRGFSVQSKDAEKGWHYRPPAALLSDRQARALARYLADGFQRVSSKQRVHFELRSLGNDPPHGHDVVAGWLAVQDPYLYVTIEQFHTQIPDSSADPYFLSGRFATPPPPPQDYRLYFKTEGFWVADPEGRQGLQYRRFLNIAETGQSEQAPV